MSEESSDYFLNIIRKGASKIHHQEFSDLVLPKFRFSGHQFHLGSFIVDPTQLAKFDLYGISLFPYMIPMGKSVLSSLPMGINELLTYVKGQSNSEDKKEIPTEITPKISKDNQLPKQTKPKFLESSNIMKIENVETQRPYTPKDNSNQEKSKQTDLTKNLEVKNEPNFSEQAKPKTRDSPKIISNDSNIKNKISDHNSKLIDKKTRTKLNSEKNNQINHQKKDNIKRGKIIYVKSAKNNLSKKPSEQISNFKSTITKSQPSIYKPSAKPSEYKPSEYKPSEYKPSTKPSEYKPTIAKQSDHKPSAKPSEYKPSAKPSAKQSVFNQQNLHKKIKQIQTRHEFSEPVFKDSSAKKDFIIKARKHEKLFDNNIINSKQSSDKKIHYDSRSNVASSPIISKKSLPAKNDPSSHLIDKEMSPLPKKITSKFISKKKSQIQEQENIPSINIKNLDIHVVGPSIDTVQPTFNELIQVAPVINSNESMNKNYLWKYKVGI